MPTPTEPTDDTGDAVTAVTADTLITVPQVAHRLGVPVRHIRRLVAERKIPYFKWGHLIRFDPTELDAWLRRRAAQRSADDEVVTRTRQARQP